jgi:2Fe-2S ferredoxin
MPTLSVITRAGQQVDLPAESGRSVMETIRDGGIDDLLALCGGCCSCATCHIYVDDSFFAQLPPMGDDENDLLDGSSHRAANSRLSCQIPLSSDLDGLRVTIAPEE